MLLKEGANYAVGVIKHIVLLHLDFIEENIDIIMSKTVNFS